MADDGHARLLAERGFGRSPGWGEVRRTLRSCLIMAGLTILVLAALAVAARLWSGWVWARHREQLRVQLAQVAPLLTALEAYHADFDAYPPVLGHLTPAHLAAVPAPPFDFPTPGGWRYSSDPEEVRGAGERYSTCDAPHATPDDVYHLWVPVPTGYTPLNGLFSDALVYRPDESYSDLGYGGALERIDGWGYYHE